MNLDKHIAQISKLKPFEDSKFEYNKSNWSKLDPEYQKLISDFEDKAISRADVIDTYKEYYLGKCDAMRAFVLTMVWGFANIGYGTYRTNTYIEKPENVALINKAIDDAKQNDLKSAFTNLRRVGLGISYISKVLYFATRAEQQSNYALIYDARVARALIQLTAPQEIVQLVKINPSSKFTDYKQYNELMHDLASKHKLEAESIELFLFNYEKVQ